MGVEANKFPSRLPGLFLFYIVHTPWVVEFSNFVSIPPAGIVPFLPAEQLREWLGKSGTEFPSRLPGLFLFYCNS